VQEPAERRLGACYVGVRRRCRGCHTAESTQRGGLSPRAGDAERTHLRLAPNAVVRVTFGRTLRTYA
jgi:hypothetical protein